MTSHGVSQNVTSLWRWRLLVVTWQKMDGRWRRAFGSSSEQTFESLTWFVEVMIYSLLKVIEGKRWRFHLPTNVTRSFCRAKLSLLAKCSDARWHDWEGNWLWCRFWTLFGASSCVWCLVLQVREGVDGVVTSVVTCVCWSVMENSSSNFQGFVLKQDIVSWKQRWQYPTQEVNIVAA